MTAHKPNRKCQHRIYLMTCEDYDHLAQRADGRCEICQTPGEDTGHGELHLDHDQRRGQWAVRGLICCPCNTSLPDRTPWILTEAQRRYLDNPWVDERFGAEALRQKPEPPVGSVAGAPGKRAWIRRPDAWYGLGGYEGSLWKPSWN